MAEIVREWSMQAQKFLLTLASNADVDAIRQDCEKLGLEQIQVLVHAGVITGIGNPSLKEALRCVNGVNEVEAEKQVRLAPPDSDIQ
jgi:hypothetical protein